jgi:hypothetical protein
VFLTRFEVEYYCSGGWRCTRRALSPSLAGLLRCCDILLNLCFRRVHGSSGSHVCGAYAPVCLRAFFFSSLVAVLMRKGCTFVYVFDVTLQTLNSNQFVGLNKCLVGSTFGVLCVSSQQMTIELGRLNQRAAVFHNFNCTAAPPPPLPVMAIFKIH